MLPGPLAKRCVLGGMVMHAVLCHSLLPFLPRWSCIHRGPARRLGDFAIPDAIIGLLVALAFSLRVGCSSSHPQRQGPAIPLGNATHRLQAGPSYVEPAHMPDLTLPYRGGKFA